MVRVRFHLVGLAALVPALLPPAAASAGQAALHHAAHQDLSAPLRDMIPLKPGEEESEVEPVSRIRPEAIGPAQADPVLQSSVAPLVATTSLLDFAGVRHGFTGPQGPFFVGRVPPDTNG